MLRPLTPRPTCLCIGPLCLLQHPRGRLQETGEKRRPQGDWARNAGGGQREAPQAQREVEGRFRHQAPLPLAWRARELSSHRLTSAVVRAPLLALPLSLDRHVCRRSRSLPHPASLSRGGGPCLGPGPRMAGPPFRVAAAAAAGEKGTSGAPCGGTSRLSRGAKAPLQMHPAGGAAPAAPEGTKRASRRPSPSLRQRATLAASRGQPRVPKSQFISSFRRGKVLAPAASLLSAFGAAAAIRGPAPRPALPPDRAHPPIAGSPPGQALRTLQGKKSAGRGVSASPRCNGGVFTLGSLTFRSQSAARRNSGLLLKVTSQQPPHSRVGGHCPGPPVMVPRVWTHA